MNAVVPSSWSSADFCMAGSAGEAGQHLSDLAEVVDGRVCRTGFDSPGFCLVDLGATASSQSLRRLMIGLKKRLQAIHRSRAGRDLVLLSAGRFDQQVTTKLHRDGGPDECFLMLGYEPSQVPAEIAIADYSKCAHDMGLTPSEFLERYNPMFTAGEELLRPYTTRVTCFSNRNSQILLINNSIAPSSREGGTWQGVLHTATIRDPSDALRRVVNSTLVAPVPLGTPEPLSEEGLEEFLCTSVVRRRGYDKPQVEDDASPGAAADPAAAVASGRAKADPRRPVRRVSS